MVDGQPYETLWVSGLQVPELPPGEPRAHAIAADDIPEFLLLDGFWARLGHDHWDLSVTPPSGATRSIDDDPSSAQINRSFVKGTLAPVPADGN